VFLWYIDAAHLRPGGRPAIHADLSAVEQDATTWSGHTAIFWARIMYSMLAMPFTLFQLPGLSGILTHTTPTGYNKYGFCVNFTMHPLPKERTK